MPRGLRSNLSLSDETLESANFDIFHTIKSSGYFIGTDDSRGKISLQTDDTERVSIGGGGTTTPAPGKTRFADACCRR